jgi:pimeloyl-ACP methyl ester carboxylesterase
MAEQWTAADLMDAPTSAHALGIGTDGVADGAGVRLHFVTMGEGPLVLLLHGFPDFWYGWRRQIPALAAAGYRVVAPDLRGYNLSQRPLRVEDYRRDVLADDVAALVGALGERRAHVVGHDWGGVIAWHLAVRHPAVIDRLAILNAPHPVRMRALLGRSTQAARSWYMGLFQLPWLPERLLSVAGRRLLHRTWSSMHRTPGAFTAADHAAYDAAFAAPGAVFAALAYYRALRHTGMTIPAERRLIPHPTLVLWGERDPALVAANAEGLERWVRDVRVVRVPDAGHWVMADAPALTNETLARFLAP